MKKISILFAGTILTVLLLVAVGVSTRSNLITPPASTSTTQSTLLVSTPVPVQTSTPFIGEVTRLAWFYKPPVDDNLDFIVDNFDFFILTHKDENERNKLKADGFEMPISQYLLFLVINDPGRCDEEPNGNQVAYKTGDFCAIDQQHPDWFLVDNSGTRIKSGKNSYYMDPGNEGYRLFWLERARELQESYGWRISSSIMLKPVLQK
jgi:hypothetical protein